MICDPFKSLRASMLIGLCAALAGCPPTDELDMGMFEADGDLPDRALPDGALPDGAPLDAGTDMATGDMAMDDMGTDAGACEDPPDAAPPNPLTPEGYAGCYRDRFQVESQVGGGIDLLGLQVPLAAALNADLGVAIDQNWWADPPMSVTVSPVIDVNRFLQVEFRNAAGDLTPVNFEWQCAVVERIQTQVEAQVGAAARARINIGRACPVVALGAIDEPSTEMQAWHLASMGIAAAPGMHPLPPRGPMPGAAAGADVVLIDGGVDPALVGPLGVNILPAVGDLDAESDLGGHGSAMALLIRQVAPDARLHSIRVLGPDNIGSIPDLARALDAASTLGGGACEGDILPAEECLGCADEALDADGDGWCVAQDNCPETPNPDQRDSDDDGIGDACDDYTCVVRGRPDADGCDGVDNDCDGQVDETPGHVCPALGCRETPACVNGMPVCVNERASTLEVCDGIANECDGGPDMNIQQNLCAVGGDWCQAGRSECGARLECNVMFECEGACRRDDVGQACAAPGEGRCAGGITICSGGRVICESVWRAVEVDRCGDGDTDCDGAVDEDADNGPCVTELPGACAVGNWACTPEGSACAPPMPGEEICNGIDDDCDGQADEDLDCAVCCELNGRHRLLSAATCAQGEERDAAQCETVCCEDGRRAARGDCAPAEDPAACNVCCVDNQPTPIGEAGAPMLVNLSLGWPPELSQPRILKGDPAPGSDAGECVVTEDPVGESVRGALLSLARRDAEGTPTAVFAASGNRPGRARDDGRGGQVNNLADQYAALFRVRGAAPDNCGGRYPLPPTPHWFLPGGWSRTPTCAGRPDDPPFYLAFGLGGIADNDRPTVQSINGAEPPLVGPGQHVYVDHPALQRRPAYMCAERPPLEGLEGPFPFTGTSVPTALATGAAAKALGVLHAANGTTLGRRALARLLYFTGRGVDPEYTGVARTAAFGGQPVQRLDACRMEFALTDASCAPLRNCLRAGNSPSPLDMPCTAADLACLANAEAPNGPCAERPRAPVPLNPNYTPDPGCQDAVLCTSDWQDAAMTCGATPCPFEMAPDRHSMGTLSGTPVVTGCPDCYLDAVKARFEVVVNDPLNVVSATLIYDEAPNNYSIKYLSLPATQWYKGDSFHINGLDGYANVCPSFAKLDIVHKDDATGQYISDTSPIRVECQ